MPTQDIADTLRDHDLSPPDLEMLRPTEARYRSLLMQPSGPISATQERIGPLDIYTAAAKAKDFLKLARTSGTHLAITPEYFFPWTSLQEAIIEGLTPGDEALWVLGSESITEQGLEQFKQAVGNHCLVLHEPLDALAADRPLLDPAVLLFRAIRADRTTQLVALVQFKTFPSRDDLFLEEEWLRRGTLIYRFRGRTGHLAAAVIICSDAFALDDAWLKDFNDRTTLIHIQLNPNPRNIPYRQYRAATFQSDPKVTDCHIVCLNWAHSIVQHGEPGAPTEPWRNIAGSTWYCPSDGCTSKDSVVIPNHNLGLYYAYMRERRHALLFHYDESVFELLVPKLLNLGQAVMVNRNGPTAFERYVWNGAALTWDAGVAPDPGFNDFVNDNPLALSALEHILAVPNPLTVERVLALSAGAINGSDSWYRLEDIDSCQIGADEVVCRLTVAQDRMSSVFRHNRLDTAAQIHHEILNANEWPPQVNGIDHAATLQWLSATPNYNVRTAGGVPTLVVYLGERPPPRERETKADMFYHLLRKTGGPHQKRLCIIYREFGVRKFASIEALTRFDDASEDKTDIMAVLPLNDIGG
ncbi:hypothetical protein [Pseudomonas lurida]|uniref:hypothetical protein n=1 Tax=Pseudomonas lurida TaxID=244566 RepID=UPI001CA4303C|nr:hypothetical protein [Pseudomonas lurida]